MDKRRILVTSALPYANGPIHIGHLVEYIQTDIWVRFQKLQGHECHYVCADDAHGTPIMLRAEREGITPEALINRVAVEHKRDFDRFNIDFDNYYSTHSEENRVFCEQIYGALCEKGHIVRKQIQQLFDPEKHMFLPDRFVKGTCPGCKSPDQYGDNCEVCGKTYSPTDLLSPYSALSGAPPIIKETEHDFFDLPQFDQFLRNWLGTTDRVQPQIYNKLIQWLEDGLQPWDITRDNPYFGFKIPDTTDKYFYVWLDAPVGYMASFKNLCDRVESLSFDDFWGVDSTTELYHFIGKDIVYFHALFWPAELHAASFRTPTKVFAHGFLTVNGKKMSKSRGTFIMAETFAKHFKPELLRYYFASKLNGSIEDIDLNLEEFVQKVNTDLVGKIVNIASRSAGFLHKFFNGKLCPSLDCDAQALYDSFVSHQDRLLELYEERDTSAAIRTILQLADTVNEYIDETKPWILAKTAIQNSKDMERLHGVVSLSLNLFRVIASYLAAITPELSQKSLEFLKVNSADWRDLGKPLVNHGISVYQPLLERIHLDSINTLLEETQKFDTEKPKNTDQQEKVTTETASSIPKVDAVSIKDFDKLDLRVGKIIEVIDIPESKKLYQLKVDLGKDLGVRTIFSGLKTEYTTGALQTKRVVVITNLLPKKMRFGVSHGMILTAGDKPASLIQPEKATELGSKVC